MKPDLILAGSTRALARAATLIESQTQAGRELIAQIFPHTGKAQIIGITGPPGSGKSTLVNAITKEIRAGGQTVGVIAVDPSSPYSRGAILGDRIRMTEHHDDPGVFIRSVASRERLGGLAACVLDLALLLDAAGRDVILIETVGVGQDEVDIARLADVTVVVLAPGFGDDVQTIKAGMMEIADVFAINKADLPGADRLEREIRFTQGLNDPKSKADIAPVHCVVATEDRGVEELMRAVYAAFENRGERNSRARNWSFRLRELLRESLLARISESEIERYAELVAARKLDPYAAVESLMKKSATA